MKTLTVALLSLVLAAGCTQQFDRPEFPTAHLDYVSIQKNPNRVDLSSGDELAYEDAATAFSEVLSRARNPADMEVLLAAFVDVFQYENHRANQ